MRPMQKPIRTPAHPVDAYFSEQQSVQFPVPARALPHRAVPGTIRRMEDEDRYCTLWAEARPAQLRCATLFPVGVRKADRRV